MMGIASGSEAISFHYDRFSERVQDAKLDRGGFGLEFR